MRPFRASRPRAAPVLTGASGNPLPGGGRWGQSPAALVLRSSSDFTAPGRNFGFETLFLSITRHRCALAAGGVRQNVVARKSLRSFSSPSLKITVWLSPRVSSPWKRNEQALWGLPGLVKKLFFGAQKSGGSETSASNATAARGRGEGDGKVGELLHRSLFTSEPSTVTGREKSYRQCKIKAFHLSARLPAFASAGGEKHFQHPRCKNQLNCQIPGTEPRAGGKTPRRHLLSKSSCPTLPTRVTDGGGKRRPGHPRARPPGLPGSGAGGAQTETAPERFTRGFASIVL